MTIGLISPAGKVNEMFLTKEQMEKLTTKRLLAYKNKLMQYPEGPDWDTNEGMNKSHSEWKQTYQNLKDILATREHITYGT